MIFKVFFFNILFQLVRMEDENEVCHKGYGCFDLNPPYCDTVNRPFQILPHSPQRINTKFYLYTRANTSGEIMSLKEIPASFDPKLPTKFIVHGYLQHSQKKWILDMKDAFLSVENLNVITVDYYTKFIIYELAVINARIIGIDVANLIQQLVTKTGVDLNDIHIIGHSLGAHVSGYAGERLNGLIGRITGLDPAARFFDFTDNKVKLDSSDAKFVDIIHTDTNFLYNQFGLGILEPVGHVDFYPNGGYRQPNCESLASRIVCSHVNSYKFFIESIKNQNCLYVAYQCASKEDFDKGNCLNCSAKGCNVMGYGASPSKDLGSLYLNTRGADNSPSCKYYYFIKLYSNDLPTMNQARGKFFIVLKNSLKKSNNETLDDSYNVFKQDSITSHLLSSNTTMNGKIESISLYYIKTTSVI